MEEKKLKELYLPALRAHMGDWVYYVTIMKLSDIGNRIHYAEELYESPKLRDLLQREIKSKRAKEIADYLLKNEQRFFNSLIVGVYGGEPKWLEINVKEISDKELPLNEQGILGYLELSGKETLFALDGQHRISGIKEALRKNKKSISGLDNEEISVIFIGHKTTQEGKERTRRLFTTLNRNAKRVTLSETIALDEDDICAILTRRLVENFRLFKNDKISLTKGSSLSKGDYQSFTNIVSLYKCLNEILVVYLLKKKILGSKKKWRDFKKLRASDEVLKNSETFLIELWEEIIKNCNELVTYIENFEKNKIDPAKEFRNNDGGSILFRPIGIQIYFQTVSILYQYDDNLKEAIKRVSKIDRNLNNDVWNDVIWDSRGNKILYGKENKDLARYLALYVLGFDLNRIRYSESKLKSLYASVIKKDEDQISLPFKVK